MPILLLLSKYCESLIAPLSVPGEVTGPEQTETFGPKTCAYGLLHPRRKLLPHACPQGRCTPGNTFHVLAFLPFASEHTAAPSGNSSFTSQHFPIFPDLGQIYALLVMGETAEEGMCVNE